MIRAVRVNRPYPFRHTKPHSLLRDFSTPRQYLRFRASCFSFLDVASAVVEQRQTRPTDLVVRPKLDRFFSRFDCFVKSAELHQRHAERVPAIEEIWIEIDTPPVLLDRALELAYSEIPIRVVKNLVARFHCRTFSRQDLPDFYESLIL